MFFLFSKARVREVLLRVSVAKHSDLLDKVEHRHAVPYRTQDRVAIRCESHVPLTVDGAAEVLNG